MDKIRDLANRIVRGGYVFAAGGKLCRRFDDGGTDVRVVPQFGWQAGELAGSIMPSVVGTPEDEVVVVNEQQPVVQQQAVQQSSAPVQPAVAQPVVTQPAFTGRLDGAMYAGAGYGSNDVLVPYAAGDVDVSPQSAYVTGGTWPSVYLTGEGEPYYGKTPEEIGREAMERYAENLKKIDWTASPYLNSEAQIANEADIRYSRLSSEQRMLHDALNARPVITRGELEAGLLAPGSQASMTAVASPVMPADTIVRDGKADYVTAKLLGKSDATAASNAAGALKSADADTIKAVQADMFRRGYYKNVKMPELPTGSKAEIEAIQRKLKAAGYDLGTYGVNKDGIDGRAGKLTRAAWASYIKEHPGDAMLESVADGNVGPATRRALAEYYKDAYNGSLQPDPEEAATYNPDDYTKVLTAPVGHNMLRTLHDSYLDMKNLNGWKSAVADTEQMDEDGVKSVDYAWDVSDDMLTRVAEFLPANLTADSYPGWTASTKSDGKVGYPGTWDSEQYLDENSNSVLETLKKRSGLLGKIGTSLSQPGRGTIGNYMWRTTPAGIEISDGYQFKADPKRVVISDAQGTGYNETRAEMNTKYRAGNTNTQVYLIPWDVYYKMQEGK